MSQKHGFTYSTVTGYFLQDDNSTVAENVDFVFYPINVDLPPVFLIIFLDIQEFRLARERLRRGCIESRRRKDAMAAFRAGGQSFE